MYTKESECSLKSLKHLKNKEANYLHHLVYIDKKKDEKGEKQTRPKSRHLNEKTV